MRLLLGMACLVALAGCHTLAPDPRPAPAPAGGIIGVEAAQLEPGFWVRREAHPARPILTRAEIANQNRKMLAEDSSLTDLEHLPATLSAEQVRGWINRLARAPTRQVYDEYGDSVSAARIAALGAATNIEAVPAEQPLRFALITQRADLRTFPTRLRVFSSRGNTDIDRWQETALFPGTPVVIVHESGDKLWWFVVSQHYSAWVEKSHVAEGPRDAVLGYGRKTPYLVVTGASVRTVFTPERPAVSELRLEMGVRVPVLADWPAGRAVNGQNPYTGHVIELPVRTSEGRLELVPALLPGTADVSDDYLALTPGALITQAFKFLGERYGWGHSYGGRDCSGFVSEVYRAFGVDLPRNTGDQAVSPALHRIAFGDSVGHGARLAVLDTAEVGDMIFIPGHVMMVIGHYRGMPYVIHDVVGASYVGSDGDLVRVPLNGVSVTPLTPLMGGANTPFVDRIYSIQRMRP